LIRVVGIILVIALLSIPAATASLLTRKLHLRMIYAIGYGLGFTIFGLFISAYTQLSSGAVIVIFGFIVYIITYLLSKYLTRVKKVESGECS